MRTLAEQIIRDFDRGLSAVQVAQKYKIDIDEIERTFEEIQTTRREAVHNEVRGMFLQGFTIAELPKYFGFTESEIRDILELPSI